MSLTKNSEDSKMVYGCNTKREEFAELYLAYLSSHPKLKTQRENAINHAATIIDGAFSIAAGFMVGEFPNMLVKGIPLAQFLAEFELELMQCLDCAMRHSRMPTNQNTVELLDAQLSLYDAHYWLPYRGGSMSQGDCDVSRGIAVDMLVLMVEDVCTVIPGHNTDYLDYAFSASEFSKLPDIICNAPGVALDRLLEIGARPNPCEQITG
jgi:hypothetical protein